MLIRGDTVYEVNKLNQVLESTTKDFETRSLLTDRQTIKLVT